MICANRSLGRKNGRFSRFVSGRENSVPGARLCNEMRAPIVAAEEDRIVWGISSLRKADRRILRRQPEHGVLAGPLCWSIAQIGHTDATWQASFQGCLH